MLSNRLILTSIAACVATACFVAGCEPGGVREANELATHADTDFGLDHLQRWSQDVISRYELGRLHTIGPGQAFVIASEWDVEIAPTEVPDSLRTLSYERPVSVSLMRDSAKGKPTCVLISYGIKGLCVGPPTFHSPRSNWYSNEVRPGIYCYFLEH